MLEIATLKETVEQSEARALSGQQWDSNPQHSYAAATCSGESSTGSTLTHVSNPLTTPSNRVMRQQLGQTITLIGNIM